MQLEENNTKVLYKNSLSAGGSLMLCLYISTYLHLPLSPVPYPGKHCYILYIYNLVILRMFHRGGVLAQLVRG